MHGNAIPHSSSCKDLGINLADNLSWRLHYQTITSKAYINHLAYYAVILTVLWQEKFIHFNY